MKYFCTAILVMMAIPQTLHAQSSDAPLANAQLADPIQESKAQDLMATLRCIQCQGQSIADSDAPIAAAMRDEVRRQIASGKSPSQIRDWFISKYGEFISFEPAMHGMAIMLWLAPLLLLCGGVFLARGLFAKGKS